MIVLALDLMRARMRDVTRRKALFYKHFEFGYSFCPFELASHKLFFLAFTGPLSTLLSESAITSLVPTTSRTLDEHPLSR